MGPTVGLHEGTEKLIWGYREIDSREVVTLADQGLRNLHEVGGYLGIEPQEVVTFPVDYELAPSVVKSLGGGHYEYSLRWVRQSGVLLDTVKVRVQLPPRATDIVVSPGDATVSDGVVEWSAASPSDTTIDVTFAVP